MSKPILNLGHAHHPNQKGKMLELLAKGICPFCDKYLEQYHDEPIEIRGQYWVVTKNDYPYEGSRVHYLFIHRDHIIGPEEISPQAMIELLALWNRINKEHQLPGGALVWRFGDTDYTGGSVDHLHVHLVVGGSRQKDKEVLSAYIGYRI